MSKLIGPGADQLSVNADLSRTAFIDPEHLPLSDLQIQALAQKLDYRQWEKQELLKQAALLLDFENNRYVRDEGIGDWMTSRPLTDILTFSRAGSATGVNRRGVLQTVNANVPVFENGGLRLRPAETNLVGADIAGSDWANSGPNRLTMGPVVQLAGFDLRQATIAVGAPGGAYVQWLPQITITPGRVTMSTYIRHDSPGWAHVMLRDDNKSVSVYAFVNLATGVVGSTSATPGSGMTLVDAILEPLSDGVWRLDLVIQTDGTQIRPYLYGQVASNGNISSEGLIGNVWYAAVQVNQGDPAPYIPTTSAAVTRPADNALFQGQNFASVFNPTEYAVILNGTLSGTFAGSRGLQMSNTSGSERIFLEVRYDGDSVAMGKTVGGAAAYSPLVSISKQQHAFGYRISAGIADLWIDGSKVVSGFSVSNVNTTGFNHFSIITSLLAMEAHRLSIFSQRLSDAQMVTLTS